MTKPLRLTTILLAALVAAVVAASAHAAPAALQAPTNTCWKDVINDWVNHQPNVLGTYPIQCYSQAIQHLNGYADIKGYSSAPDDIHRALLAALRDERGGGGPPSIGGGSNPPGIGPSSNSNGNSSGSSGNIISRLFGAHSATSVPLPLIVLGALAVLLALAALATWLARRIQMRRPQPAPAVAKRR